MLWRLRVRNWSCRFAGISCKQAAHSFARQTDARHRLNSSVDRDSCLANPDRGSIDVLPVGALVLLGTVDHRECDAGCFVRTRPRPAACVTKIVVVVFADVLTSMNSLGARPLVADAKFQQCSGVRVGREIVTERVRVEEIVASQSRLVADQCVPLSKRQSGSISNGQECFDVEPRDGELVKATVTV